MKNFITLVILGTALLPTNVFAQWDRMEELRTRQQAEQAEQTKTVDENAPQNTQPAPAKTIAKKTDEQILKENDYVPENWREMTQEEQIIEAVKKLEDRFALITANFKVITVGGSKLCTFDVYLNNYSSRRIKKMLVNYSWGETSTPVSFDNVEPMSVMGGSLGMAGPVCGRVMDGADYEIKTCDVEGLTDEQCRMRVYPIK